MAAPSQGQKGLVTVHVAVPNPEMPEPEPRAGPYARERYVASAKYADISWSESGAEPRWLGMDTSTCAAAINPSHFHRHGADEFERFLAGAAARAEPALIIVTMGNADDDGVRSVLSHYDAGVDFRDFTGSIAGKRRPAGTDISLAPDLDAADRDLGLRLRNRPTDAPWWAMTPRPTVLEGPRGTAVHEPEGELVPILVDSLGEPVVARWMPSDGQQIWYVIPDGVDWNTVVDWIVQRALPKHVPAALRRVRSRHVVAALGGVLGDDGGVADGQDLRVRGALVEHGEHPVVFLAHLVQPGRDASGQGASLHGVPTPPLPWPSSGHLRRMSAKPRVLPHAHADGDHVGAGAHRLGLRRHRGEGVVRVLDEGRQVTADRHHKGNGTPPSSRVRRAPGRCSRRRGSVPCVCRWG
ncbi:hypothetical protein ACFYT4_33910 [Streptomyces sp. NPDC004609]|uniref:hypothetical protein n=1 Tax=Streptomyces sp. NPDC004609 TaxID=3364704 RepID=UPI0036989729